MQIYVLDNRKYNIGSIDTDSSNMSNDKFIQYLDTGAYTYEFDIILDNNNSQLLEEKNYLVFYWRKKLKMFQIETIKDTEGILHVTRNVYAVPCTLELYQNHVRPIVIEGTIETCLTSILQDTNFKVGSISPSLANVGKSMNITSITPVYTVLQDLIALFDNIELSIRVECKSSINAKYEFYIDVYDNGELGNKTDLRIEYDWNEYGLKKESDGSNYYSGLIAQGKNGITFSDIAWDVYRGDPLNKPLGQDYLVDPQIHEIYNNGGKYILGAYNSNTASTPIDLLWETYEKLQEVKSIKVNFEVPIYLEKSEYENIEIGDTVAIFNPKFNPDITLSARVGTLQISFTDPTQNKITLSNYKSVKSKIRHYSKDDIIKEAVSNILNLRVGKLTPADRLAIQNLLAKLNVDKENMDKIIDDLINKLKPDIPQLPDDIGEDLEDYTAIKINTLDKGLWLGDKRIYDLKNYGVIKISEQQDEDITTDTKAYAEAIKYYSKFNLGKKVTDSEFTSIISSSNKYKIPTIVNYWAPKFGLDPYIVFMCICGESRGVPTSATSYSGGGYGLMQCERSVYFNKKQTLTFIDGTTKSFTPSYSTMQPYKGGNTTINGVTVDKNISNQIMFGCHELRYSADWCHYNIFAMLIGNNMGIGAAAWIVNKYVAEKYGFTFKNSYLNFYSLPLDYRTKCYEVLESGTGDFASYRKDWVDYRNSIGKPAGTVDNIEKYLCFYKSNNGSLPYILDKQGKKYGLGVSNTGDSKPGQQETTQPTGSQVRNIIVETAKKIVSQHVDQKIATYDQSNRTVNFKKPNKYRGTLYGIKNPICYDCSSLVSCCYLEAGMKSVYNKGCYAGTLVAGATAKSGYMMWKVDSAGITKAKPGDIVMDANFTVTASNLTRANMIKVNKTHHTLIYIGDGKVAHASKWAYHPNAIKISNISYYQNKGSAFFLRPYELVEKDKLVSTTESTGAAGEIIQDDQIVQNKDLNAFTAKGVPGATADLFHEDNTLVSYIQVGETTDTLPYPTQPEYIFLHFGIPHVSVDDAQNVINLIETLLYKYPKTPIFIAKEWHATSVLTDYSTINTNVDEYNAILETYANSTQYVIFLDVGNVPATSDGYTCSNKASTQTYYNQVKTAIKNKVIGYTPSEDTKPEDTANNVEYVLEFKDNKDFGLVKSIFIKFYSAVAKTFWARYKFKTQKDTEPTKFTHSNIVYYTGDDCSNGALICKADTEYTILCLSNPDTTNQYNGKKYIGVVTANRGDGNYTDCGNFIGRDKMIEIAETYYTNRTKFVYNTKTPLTYTNPYKNRAKWKDSDGKYHIDCSTFVALCCKGIPYEESPYAKKWTSRDKKSSTLTWAFNPGRTAADIAEYCVSKGWVATGIDVENWTNIEKGDLIFWDRDGKDLNRFMSVSHAGICSGFDADGDATTIEVTTVTNAVYKRKLKDNKPGNVILVCRIRKD